ncbi:MAG TPA: hypothetical protein VJ184_01275 [Chryseolinea sp.]|nr:hypothetical protein [Chryseolinea sp.]
MKTLLTTGFIILVFTACVGQTKNTTEPLIVSDLQFRSIFGFKPADNENVFSLLGNSFFGTPKSEDSDSLIRAWIKSHPNASVIPVTSFGPAKIADQNSNMIYCWIIDKEDTLNNHLIRSGCFPGVTMNRPKTWQEMTKEERIYKEGNKPTVEVYVGEKDYDKFLKQIKSAEIFARKK